MTQSCFDDGWHLAPLVVLFVSFQVVCGGQQSERKFHVGTFSPGLFTMLYKSLRLICVYFEIMLSIFNISNCGSSRWSHQQLQLIIHDHQHWIFRISLSEIKEHDWVTMYGLNPLLKEEENCQLIEVRQWSGKDYWKGKGWWKSFFQKNVLKFLKLFSRWPSTRCRTASAPSPSLTLSFWSR